MDFINHTPNPARLLTGSSGNRETIAIAVCKATCQVKDGSLVPVADEEAWPIFDRPYTFEDIGLAPETDFRKKGVDLLVFGKAVAPHGDPVSSLRVSIKCGKVCHETIVFGNRIWESIDDALRPSKPEPFLTLPLSNQRTFGGTAKLEDIDVVHPINPEGCGFLLNEDEASGTPLPNIEDPDALIENWQDSPRPACWFKPVGILRPKDAPEVPPEKMPLTIMQSLFNQAVPELIADPEELGDNLRMVGFSEDGDLVFPVPDIRGPIVDVHVGKIRGRFPALLSTLIILPGERIIIATYTALFRYLMRPFEKRSAILNWPDGIQAAKTGDGENTHV